MIDHTDKKTTCEHILLQATTPNPFCRKTLADPFSGHCLPIKSQMQNLSMRSSGMCRKQSSSWRFLFAFSLLLFFRFSCLVFFLVGHLQGFILVGKVFGKAFRILELDRRKDRWVVKQDVHGNFQVNATRFFAFFSGLLDWMMLVPVWFETSLYPAQVTR